MHGALWWSWGGDAGSYERGTPVSGRGEEVEGLPGVDLDELRTFLMDSIEVERLTSAN